VARQSKEVTCATRPKDPEGFTYDADGNLTLDGVWEYSWDAENRLRRMEMRDSVAAVLLTGSNPWVAIDFVYYWMGRRIGKTYQTSTSDPATSGGKYGPPILWMISRDARYVYDGWMLSMSYKSGGSSLADQSFAWGPDLSGGYGGAGGIGGLVAYTDDEHDALNPAPSDPDFLGPMFPIYDGNGNIVKMVRFESLGGDPIEIFEARESASYEYGPFGENRSTTGELGVPAEGGTHQGQRNPFRFSTKFTDAETGLLYYGYRYYSPSMGRWVNRDPIGETADLALYRFVRNGPVSAVDPIGGWTYRPNGQFNTLLTDNAEHVEGNGSFFSLTFMPGEDGYTPTTDFEAVRDCISCQTFDFIQIYKADYFVHSYFEFGWQVDNERTHEEANPFYPDTRDHGRGIKMDDNPEVPDYLGSPREGWFEAETCAVCAQGKDRGHVYGCVYWNWNIKRWSNDSLKFKVKRSVQGQFNPGRGVFGENHTHGAPPWATLDDSGSTQPERTVLSYNTRATPPSSKMRSLILENARFSKYFAPGP